uniref:Chaperone protein htpG n=1 Tax=Lygus hesperus TaxID=30085 RepID=A0A0A9VXQ3_LYGHE
MAAAIHHSDFSDAPQGYSTLDDDGSVIKNPCEARMATMVHHNDTSDSPQCVGRFFESRKIAEEAARLFKAAFAPLLHQNPRNPLMKTPKNDGTSRLKTKVSLFHLE